MKKRFSTQILANTILTALSVVSVNAYSLVQINGLGDITISGWAGGSGDLSGSDDFCIVSNDGSNPGDTPARDFALGVVQDDLSPSTQQFRMQHATDSTTLDVEVFVTIAATQYALDNYDFNNDNTGLLNIASSVSCANSNFEVRIPAASLLSASAGIYTANVRPFVWGGQGFWIFREYTEVAIQLELPQLVEITRLNDIPLGTWDSVSTMQATESFCIFSNGYSGVALTVSSPNAATSFNLVGPDSVPYEVEFVQGGAYHSAVPGVPLGNATTGFVGDSTRDCGNSDNSALRVTVDATDLAAATAGAFSDTLTVLVEPD